MSVLFTPVCIPGARGYTINNALMLDGSADYLHRTPGAPTDGTKWAISFWLKLLQDPATQGYILRVDVGNLSMYVHTDQTIQFQIGTAALTTNAIFKDPTAWYHMVLRLDTNQAVAADRFTFEVNGVSPTYSADTRTNIGLGSTQGWNTANQHWIGSTQIGSATLGGLIADFVNIDGISTGTFGEFDTNGNWQPRNPASLTFGTNGFWLKFADAVNPGTDSSGNANNFTPVSIPTTSQLADTPTDSTALDTGNYAIWSSLASDPLLHSLSNGNRTRTGTGLGNWSTAYSTLRVSSGKWYFEESIDNLGTYTKARAGFVLTSLIPIGSAKLDGTGQGYAVEVPSGNKTFNAVETAYLGTVSATDIICCALDLDAGKVWWRLNGAAWPSSGDPVAGTNPAFSGIAAGEYAIATCGDETSVATTINFGQAAFAYTPPTGYKTLNTANLSDPAIPDPTLQFKAVAYTGNSSTQSITSLGFQPDAVWIKSRTTASHHGLFNSVSGAGKGLYPSLSNAETTEAAFVSFDAAGFSLSGTGTAIDINTSTTNYIAWCWKMGGAAVSNTAGTITTSVSANTTAGMSIISYTGNSTGGATIGHGLTQAPEFVLAKNLTANEWAVYHVALGGTKYLWLDSTNAFGTDTTHWYNTDPTTTVITLGSGGRTNGSVAELAYAFHSVPGFSQVGSYTGNASADGPYVECGFRPAFVLVKNASAALTNWRMYDNTRDTYNPVSLELHPNDNTTEATATAMNFTATGFRITSTAAELNGSGNTLVYIAFAEMPVQAQSRAR